MYEIKLSKKVKKFLLKDRGIAKMFFIKIKELHISPFSNSLNIKKMQGEDNKYRLRIGKNRFLYEIIDNEILIYFYDAGSRGDIYK